MVPVLLSRYLNLRTLALVLVYTLLLGASYWIAYELRFDFNVPDEHAVDRIDELWWVLALKLMWLFGFGQMESILSYFRLPDALRLLGALFVSALILASMWYVYDGSNVPPRAVILADLLLGFLLLCGFRLAFRLKSSRGLEDWLGRDEMESVLVIGAGEVGAALCYELSHKRRLGMRPVAFLDDDRRKIGRYVHGVLVADEINALPRVARRYTATKAVIAIPSASIRRVREITELAREAGLGVEIVPALTDLVSGRAEMTQLRPVQLEDLLGRDPVDLRTEDIRAMLSGRRVLVTGAGGSIGRELAGQILLHEPGALLCVDHAEIAVFDLWREVLAGNEGGAEVRTRVADVGDTESVERIFGEFRPEVVFHAAAHKHVTLMEDQPNEALKNNFFATADLAEAASRRGVERFILISTDKAINPTSVMGASKRLAELALLEAQARPENATRFMAVRFGNVLGSSGSVIPIFRQQIAAGGPLTVTDPEVTRFFMTVQEAAGLVLQSATQGEGGEIFVLDMGRAVRIADIARQMIALSGLREGEDIEITYTGLRPGEKRYEEVQHLSESLRATRHPRVLRFVGDGGERVPMAAVSAALREAMAIGDPSSVKAAMRRFVPEYTVAE